MSFETGRKAIETYWAANWGGVWYASDHMATPVVNSVRMTIRVGVTRSAALNRLNIHVGMVTLSIYTDGGRGLIAANGYADQIMDIFHGKALDSTGALVTSAAQAVLVRFSPPQLEDQCHPYIGAQFDSPPFQQTNVIAPFVRYETR